MSDAVDIDTLDEKGGFFYEALLSYTITQKCKHIPAFEIHKKLAANAVVSDVIIPAATNPQAVILCTHSHATSGTHMKSWRNIDEMLLIRSHFPSCVIINLIFPSEWKNELLLIMCEICDHQILFPPQLEHSVLKLAHDALRQKINSA